MISRGNTLDTHTHTHTLVTAQRQRRCRPRPVLVVQRDESLSNLGEGPTVPKDGRGHVDAGILADAFEDGEDGDVVDLLEVAHQDIRVVVVAAPSH